MSLCLSVAGDTNISSYTEKSASRQHTINFYITRGNFEVTQWEIWNTFGLPYRTNYIISAVCFTELLLLQMWAVDMLWANMTNLRDQTRRTLEARDTNRYEWFALFFSFGPDILYNIKKVNLSHYRPEVPRGFQEVKVPTLRDNGPGWW